jgi:hypothetical protein
VVMMVSSADECDACCLETSRPIPARSPNLVRREGVLHLATCGLLFQRRAAFLYLINQVFRSTLASSFMVERAAAAATALSL